VIPVLSREMLMSLIVGFSFLLRIAMGLTSIFGFWTKMRTGKLRKQKRKEFVMCL